MLIQFEQKKDFILVHVHGRIDSFNLDLVQHKLTTAAKSGKSHIVLNLQEVEFIGLAATLALEKLAENLKERHGSLSIVGDNQRTSLLKRTFGERITFANTLMDLEAQTDET